MIINWYSAQVEGYPSLRNFADVVSLKISRGLGYQSMWDLNGIEKWPRCGRWVWLHCVPYVLRSLNRIPNWPDDEVARKKNNHCKWLGSLFRIAFESFFLKVNDVISVFNSRHLNLIRVLRCRLIFQVRNDNQVDGYAIFSLSNSSFPTITRASFLLWRSPEEKWLLTAHEL